MPTLPRATSIAMLLIVLPACAAPIGPVPIQTSAPTSVCPMARVGGVLVADPTWGLAFEGDSGTRGAVWPYGYWARRGEDSVVVLIDPSGRVVAREGDRIVAAGASGDDAAYLCTDLRVVPTSTP